MSFYDEARAKVRATKMDKDNGRKVADTTKTGYTRKVDQRSKKQDEARKHG